MIDRKLIGAVPESRKYVAAHVAAQWVALCANSAVMASLAAWLGRLFTGTAEAAGLAGVAAVTAGAVAVRCGCAALSARMGAQASQAVKKTLRGRIYQKLLRLGPAYRQQVRTSEVVQVTVEGVEQMETYFGAYLPQLFYAMLAPLTLFGILAPVDLPSALVLLVCVPLIPVSIAAVQTWAKKLLGKYWGQYTALGDSFLENLQGLTTLKIYRADERKNREMNEQAERFRRITMKVLTMQLNSISVMDLIAYGGAAAGVILAVTRYAAGRVELAGCLLIILLSAEFFIPMRTLGSFFHIAMNGMAASDKIFRLLALPEPPGGTAFWPAEASIRCRGLRFAYDPEREVLHGLDLDFPAGSFTAIVGPSGCGKSTVAAILMGRQRGCGGQVQVGGVPLEALREEERLARITYVSHNSPLLRGTVGDNLRMGRPDATDEALWDALEQVELAAVFRARAGLDSPVEEGGANLSGGQRQRLAMARALLHDSPVYIFDEATSNIDVESEDAILGQIHALAGRKTVILISHRLANVTAADRIYVMEAGRVAEQGGHQELLDRGGAYAALWKAQQALEQYTGGDKK